MKFQAWLADVTSLSSYSSGISQPALVTSRSQGRPQGKMKWAFLCLLLHIRVATSTIYRVIPNLEARVLPGGDFRTVQDCVDALHSPGDECRITSGRYHERVRIKNKHNLVPRLFHLTAPAPEERPWFRLVTCLANKHNPLGGVPLSNKMSRRAFVTLKARLADKSTKMFFSSLHFVIVNSSYWNINLKPKQVKCLEAVYNGKTLLPYCRQDTESPLSSIFFHRSCSTNWTVGGGREMKEPGNEVETSTAGRIGRLSFEVRRLFRYLLYVWR